MHQHEKPKHTPQFTRLQAKYQTLKTRLERAIQSGRFFRYSLHKQQQLLHRLQRYAQRLLRWGKLTTGTALVGTGLLVSEPLQGQMFTEVTGTASPFVILPVHSSEPFGIIDINPRATPTLVDIDGDGDLDMFAGNVDCNIDYLENVGDSQNPTFILRSNNNPFGLDAGPVCAPSFVDIDGDGDFDVFIGEFSNENSYFENIGDSQNPVFSLSSSSEPFGLVEFSYGSVPNYCFVDIDGDGDFDIFIGETNGNINYFENTGTSQSPAFILRSTANAFGLTSVDDLSAPSFVDIDQDGDFDAFIGEENGNVNYFENIGDSQNPVFSLSSSSEPFGLINVGSFSVPSFGDIDGDGDLDAFIARGVISRVTYFENTSTDSSIPAFTQSVVNLGNNSTPSVVDIDGDGDLDMFVGELEGNVNYFENLGGSPTPTFSLSSSSEPFGITDIGTASAPTFVDMDGDSDFDVFIGSGQGWIHYFENIGDSQNPTFFKRAPPSGITRVGIRSILSFADIDGDGDFDGFVGEGDNGVVRYFENIGDAQNPAFSLSSSSEPFGLSNVVYNSSPSFVDLDDDGDLDACVGDFNGNFKYFENTGDAQNPAFSLSSSSEPFGLPRVGDSSNPIIVDIDGDGFYEAIIGERDGNLNYFESNILVPVELTTFSAKAHNKHVLLHWQTASETNNKGFHIERSSNGKDWKAIGFVHGQGTTVETQNYTWLDDDLTGFGNLSGRSLYYRLRQVDFDGSKSYSDIVQVTLKTTKIQLSPNPVTDVLQVTNGEGRAIIYDLSGKVVKMALITDAQATLQVQDLPKGQYLLSVTRVDGTVWNERFVK